MFAFPQMVLIPVLSGVSSGSVNWPNVGVVLAWLLLSALVGTLLGLLREHGQRTPAQPSVKEVPTVRVRPMKAVSASHNHREAA